MGAIKKAFKTVTHGIGNVAKGIGQLTKGVLTLNLKDVAKGVKGVGHGGRGIAHGIANLTPAAVAANTLLDGAYYKLTKKAETFADKVADKVVDDVESGLSNVKDGAIGALKGVAHGNVCEVLHNIGRASQGGIALASNIVPGGVAKNIACAGTGAAVEVAAQEVLGNRIKA